MSAPLDQSLLARMSPEVRSALEDVERAANEGGDVYGSTRAVLEIAGIPKRSDEGIIPFASLTDGQRALFEQLAQTTWGLGASFAVPRYSFRLGRWMAGGDGVLERQVDVELAGVIRSEPLYRALHLLPPSSVGSFVDGLALPIGDRLELYLDCFLGAYDLDDRPRLTALSWGEPGEIGDELGDWATDGAGRLSQHHGRIDMKARWPVFLALARAGVQIQEAWEGLLPVSSDASLAPLTLECLRAVPEHRRPMVLVSAIRGLTFSGDIVRCALAILELEPQPGVLALLFECAEEAAQAPARTRTTRGELKRALKQLARKHQGLSAAIERYLSGGPVLPKLRIGSRRSPSAATELSPTERLQICAAGTAWDGEELTAEDRLADDGSEHSFRGCAEILRLDDEDGNPVYDAWLYAEDAGAVYVAGTTNEVAAIVQGGVECPDVGLAAVLVDLLI